MPPAQKEVRRDDKQDGGGLKFNTTSTPTKRLRLTYKYKGQDVKEREFETDGMDGHDEDRCR